MSNIQERVRPDAILSGTDFEDEEVTGPLDPCPNCGARPSEAPEGLHTDHTLRQYPHTAGTSDDGDVQPLKAGDAKWVFGHCWRCGHRPGTNQVVSQREMARQFAAFKAWMDDERAKIANERGIAPPEPTTGTDNPPVIGEGNVGF